MQFSRVGRTVSSWMAILAVLMAAIAPSVSHALRAGASAGRVEVCSLVGPKWISVDEVNDRAPAPLPSPAAGLVHCAYCTLNTVGAALPPAPQALPLLALEFGVPRHFPAEPHTPLAWQAAQARAPPTPR